MTGVKRIWGKDGVKDEAVDDLGTKVKQTVPDTNKDKPGIVLKVEYVHYLRLQPRKCCLIFDIIFFYSSDFFIRTYMILQIVLFVQQV